MKISERNFLVTGGGSGLGEATARALARPSFSRSATSAPPNTPNLRRQSGARPASRWISGANARRLLHKELAVAVLNGALWGVVVSAIAIAMFGNYHIAWIIAVAMVANLLVAAMTGVLLPLLLRNMGMDPALSGSVVLTTFTDVVGFMVFLGVATLVFM